MQTVWKHTALEQRFLTCGPWSEASASPRTSEKCKFSGPNQKLQSQKPGGGGGVDPRDSR